ncbi:DUF1080 domain-containing protein [Foetidibacter luteolus]|uniref:DUF1080 domain-containing protein n=1 Tax=Foetidibacter luteolus TaxID=2608880 RepID=UPI00129B99AD|nr:family 16 glycoside hydrolase [Foetidibacter luteolus]
MKKYLSLLTVACCATILLQAQADQRTTTTKIADLLARVPATNNQQLAANNEAMATLGTEGLETLLLSLKAPGQGDNTRVEYAVKSFSYYTVQTGKDALKKQAATAYCNALNKTNDKVTKAFIISQLQVVATDANISCLVTYLADEELADPAARALAKIHSPAAGKALLDKLGSTTGKVQATIVEALGDAGYQPAVAALTRLAASADAVTKKLALYSLAQIADPASLATLKAAAGKTGWVYEPANATSDYLVYLDNLIANGQKVQAAKAAAELLNTFKKTYNARQSHTLSAALQLAVQAQGEAAMPLLLKEADVKDHKYQGAVLLLAGKHLTHANAAPWMKKLTTTDKWLKSGIITLLADNKIIKATPAFISALADTDPAVRLSAVNGLGKLRDAQAIPALLGIMKKGNPAEITAAKNALLLIAGTEVVHQSAAALGTAPPAAKAALMEVLAERSAQSYFPEALALTKSNDTSLQKAAFTSLKSLAAPTSLPSLYSLLLTTGNEANTQAVQQAIIAASAGITDSAQRVQQALTAMQQAPPDKKARFYPILSATGSLAAQQTIAAAFNQGDDASKQAIIASLSSWPDASALKPLFLLAEQPGNSAMLTQLLKGYTQLAIKSGAPDDQKLLYLHKAMDIAQTNEQKLIVLSELDNCKTLPALLHAASFLDNAELKQPAATVVMNIALSGLDLNGGMVKQILEKTIAALQGPDSDYQKQALRKLIAEMPEGEGFVPMFNGKDLTGWKGLVANPIERAKMNADTLEAHQKKADEIMRQGWSVQDGTLLFNGHGDNLCTIKKYADFEMYVDWKITKDGDAGIYLRGTPQVQIWDTSRRDVGAEVGSGGLYNNQNNPSKPLVMADNPIGEWNSFHIIMKGERVTVYLNGQLVVNNTVLENYWDRKLPLFTEEQIELQAHGTNVWYRDLYIRELPSTKPFVLSEEEQKEGYKVLFDGTNLNEWVGNKTDYVTEDGAIAVHPKNGGHGNLYSKDEYNDFSFRFEFKLTPGGNNGIGIRAPLEGDAAYVGMEIQVLDNEAEIYKDLHEYQYHGSVYGVIPAKRGFLKPVGEWNTEEIIATGSKIKVILNGTTILDGDIAEASKNGTADGKDHPGLKRTTGHIGFLGHGDTLWFRNIRVKDLGKQ